MWVLKANNEVETFDTEKIYRTCIRAGLNEKNARMVVEKVKARVYDGITTKKVLQLIINELMRISTGAAAKYDLKNAIMDLGPTGYPFEEFISDVLAEYGYKTKTNQMIKGACIEHEVDVVAEKGNQRVMIECKYHNKHGVYTDVQDVLYTYARYQDLCDGYKAGTCQKFDEVWMVTNTKCSTQAAQYAKCKNMKVIGWNYPPNKGLDKMIDGKRLYPITVLRSVNNYTKEKLSQIGYVLAKELLRHDVDELYRLTGITRKTLKKIIKEVKMIYAK